MEGGVIEGFLCPICFKDLKTALNLNSHFQEHSQGDQNLFKSVKGIYHKAKKKIIGVEPGQSTSDGEPSEVQSSRVPGYAASTAENPKFIMFRSHTDRFRAIRDLRNERYASQTNTLLIRLGKLLQQLPADPIRRKAFEQEVVPWLDDKNVNLCPYCARSFHLLTRKHHCRLCGYVMCRNCIFLLPLDDAYRMTETQRKETPLVEAMSEWGLSTKSGRYRPSVEKVKVLSRDNLVDNRDFRICQHCHSLLHSRENMRQNRKENPIICQFYERLVTAMKACDALLESYISVQSSLCAGETKHTLAEATSLRIDLLRLADNIDIISKKIVVLGQNTVDQPQGINVKLQQSVRNAAAIYLKKNIVSLPSLPSEEEIIEYQERRRLEIEREIDERIKQELEEEKRMAQERRIQSKQFSAPADYSSAIVRSTSGKVTIDEGWTPSVKQAIISDDPLLEQIGILHGFIEQAERAGKEDECAALRQNLMELEEALDKREAASHS